MNIIQELEKEQLDKLSASKTIPEFGPGDTVIVNVKVVEGERTRVQAYEGVCIGRSGGGLNESFTVRKISYGEGVERVFPVLSPMIDSIKVVRRGKVRRAKLYYLRDLRGKSARIVEKKTERQAAAAARVIRLLHGDVTKSAGSAPRFFVAACRHCEAVRMRRMTMLLRSLAMTRISLSRRYLMCYEAEWFQIRPALHGQRVAPRS